MLGRDDGLDPPNQGCFLMPSCRHCQPPQPANWQNDIAMLEQPDAGLCDEHVDFKRIDRGSAQRGNQVRFHLFVNMASAESLKR
jgi:hypothetical protein